MSLAISTFFMMPDEIPTVLSGLNVKEDLVFYGENQRRGQYVQTEPCTPDDPQLLRRFSHIFFGAPLKEGRVPPPHIAHSGRFGWASIRFPIFGENYVGPSWFWMQHEYDRDYFGDPLDLAENGRFYRRLRSRLRKFVSEPIWEYHGWAEELCFEKGMKATKQACEFQRAGGLLLPNAPGRDSYVFADKPSAETLNALWVEPRKLEQDL